MGALERSAASDGVFINRFSRAYSFAQRLFKIFFDYWLVRNFGLKYKVFTSSWVKTPKTGIVKDFSLGNLGSSSLPLQSINDGYKANLIVVSIPLIGSH